MPIGCQTYPVAGCAGQGFRRHACASSPAIGYRTIEMCSPPGYRSSGFGPLESLSAADMRKTIQDAGLRCESCHYHFRELKEKLPETDRFRQRTRPQADGSFHLRRAEQRRPRPSGRSAAEELNEIARAGAEGRPQLGFHNHNFEFREIDGVLIYDHIMPSSTRNLSSMQFQVSVIMPATKPRPTCESIRAGSSRCTWRIGPPQRRKPCPSAQGVVELERTFSRPPKPAA